MAKDYYDILGINRQADQAEIKKAFRQKAHEHHPDKGGDAEKFKEINEAYQILGNNDKRRQYDQFGSGAFDSSQGGGFGGFQNAGGFRMDFEDLNEMFGGFGDWFGFGNRRESARQGTARGRDLEMSISLDFLEAAFGVEKLISYVRQGACSTCNGQGAAADSKFSTCSTCNGQGKISRLQRTILGNMQVESLCPDCRGEGQKPEKICQTCNGSGLNKEKMSFKVKIPAGIDDGGSIRLPGRGELGAKGGVAGDLYLRIRVSPHKDFSRQGSDIKSEEIISFFQAAGGDKIEVKTVHGPVKLKIPEGTADGTTFRLKNKGLNKINGSGQGDHFVVVRIKVPKGLNRRQKKVLEEVGLS